MYFESYIKSDADCVLYTYGVGDSRKQLRPESSLIQAAPPYFLKLAKAYPEKLYEMIHWDSDFSPERPLRQREWVAVGDAFQHKTLTNLRVRFIPCNFPSERSYDARFQAVVQERLNRGGEVFLGVHELCWTDMHCCLGETYNLFRKQYTGRIHFYIQSLAMPAFLYKGEYRAVMGLFARTLCHEAEPEVWQAYKLLFSRPHPSEYDKNIIVGAVAEIFQHHRGMLFSHLEGREFAATSSTEKDVLDYINHPLANRLILLPLEELTPEIIYANPGEEPFPGRSQMLSTLAIAALLILGLTITYLAGVYKLGDKFRFFHHWEGSPSLSLSKN